MTLFEWKVTRNYYQSLFKVQRNSVMHLKTNRLYCVERERNPLGIQSTRLKEDAWRLQLANWQLVLYILIHSSYINQGLEPRFKVSIIGCSTLGYALTSTFSYIYKQILIGFKTRSLRINFLVIAFLAICFKQLYLQQVQNSQFNCINHR